VLEQHGLKLGLVDARQLQYVPGRKTDVQDCQWLQKLMSLGRSSSYGEHLQRRAGISDWFTPSRCRRPLRAGPTNDVARPTTRQRARPG
jgi:hypothetical protein